MSISHLPPELLLEVFGSGLDTIDLARVCRSCRLFRDLAEPILYATVSLASMDQIRSFILALRASPSRENAVYALEVDWSDEFDEEDEPDGFFWDFHTCGAFHDGTPRALELGPTEIDLEATVRGMSDGICTGIRESVPSAHVVLLLDMLPRLQSLRVVPSSVEFWFWAAFPNPCDPDTPKRLPQGLLSVESLDVQYTPDFDTSDMSILNDGLGYAHVKIITALLLPNLRRLSFGGDDGDEDEWVMHYCGDDSPLVDMDHLKSRSGVKHLKLRGTSLLPEELLPEVLDMLAAPESVHLEQEDEFDFTPFDTFIARPTLRSFALVEYPGDYLQREEGWEPLRTLSKCDHLTHIALPVHALAQIEDEDLARAVPRGVEHLDIAYPSAHLLEEDVARLVKLVHNLAQRGSRVRRLTVRPAMNDSRSTPIRTACAASGIAFVEEPWIEAPDGPYDAYGSDDAYDDLSPYEDEYDSYDDQYDVEEDDEY